MKNLFSTILFLFVTGFIFAQAPQGINYQAVIRDATGNILTNQNVRLRINIRTASVSGTVAYAETHSAITNAYGLVNLVIGQGTTQTGIFSNLSWGSNSHFAEIQADITGGTNYVTIGTQQLMSVPYALYAEKTNDDNQTLSINGSSLSISGGNSVMLPSGITNKIYQQDILNSFYFGGGPCSSELFNASSHVNAESFIVNQSFGLIQYKKDANTGLFYATGSNNLGCSVIYYSSLFHNNQIYSLCIQTGGGGTRYIEGPSGVMTLVGASISTTTNGVMFSDGVYVYVHNTGDNWTKFTVSGNTMTNAGTFILSGSNGSTQCVMYDGNKLYHLNNGSIDRVSLSTGLIENSIISPITGVKGIIDGGNNIYYLMTNTVIGSNEFFKLNPMTKP